MEISFQYMDVVRKLRYSFAARVRPPQRESPAREGLRCIPAQLVAVALRGCMHSSGRSAFVASCFIKDLRLTDDTGDTARRH